MYMFYANYMFNFKLYIILIEWSTSSLKLTWKENTFFCVKIKCFVDQQSPPTTLPKYTFYYYYIIMVEKNQNDYAVKRLSHLKVKTVILVWSQSLLHHCHVSYPAKYFIYQGFTVGKASKCFCYHFWKLFICCIPKASIGHHILSSQTKKRTSFESVCVCVCACITMSLHA